MIMNMQSAPYPEKLAELVNKLQYKPGWTFDLLHIDRDKAPDGTVLGAGLTLDIVTKGYDSYHPERGQNYSVHHYRPVPPATYDMRSWRRWLLDQIRLVEDHEACEFFVIDGERPYAPSHGPGNDPYIIREIGTEEDQRTSFRGIVKES